MEAEPRSGGQVREFARWFAAMFVLSHFVLAEALADGFVTYLICSTAGLSFRWFAAPIWMVSILVINLFLFSSAARAHGRSTPNTAMPPVPPIPDDRRA